MKTLARTVKKLSVVGCGCVAVIIPAVSYSAFGTFLIAGGSDSATLIVRVHPGVTTIVVASLVGLVAFWGATQARWWRLGAPVALLIWALVGRTMSISAEGVVSVGVYVVPTARLEIAPPSSVAEDSPRHAVFIARPAWCVEVHYEGKREFIYVGPFLWSRMFSALREGGYTVV